MITFHPENSHVIPAMMGRFHNALLSDEKEVVIWGSGTPMREFLHVDDMAAASIHVMNLDGEIYSIRYRDRCYPISMWEQGLTAQ